MAVQTKPLTVLVVCWGFLGAAAWAADSADPCTGLVDPYNPVAEQALFNAAAGNDGELSEDEFTAQAKQKGTFARPFDSWAKLKAHDSDRSGTISWLEADAYRRQVRKQVLSEFDKNKDDRLTGQERKAANRYLAGGKFGTNAGGKPTTLPTTGKSAGNAREMIRKYDADRDGELSEEELKLMQKEMGKQYHEQMLKKYDTDGDGTLSAEEWKAARTQSETGQRMKQIALKFHDVDGDGELSDAEKKRRREFGRRFREIGKSVELMMQDYDGDGKVSEKEKKMFRREVRGNMLQAVAVQMHYVDANGDGQMSLDEMQNFQARVMERTIGYLETKLAACDLDKDGKYLSDKEHDAVFKVLNEEFTGRFKEGDTDGDGRVSIPETLKVMVKFADDIGLKKTTATTRPSGQ